MPARGCYPAPMVLDRDLVKAFLVVQGNRIVRQPLALDLTPFEGALGTGLRAGAGAALWFEEETGKKRLPFEPWLSALRAAGLRGIRLVPAVPGLAPTLLALDLGPAGRRVYADRWERDVPAGPSARSLLEFARRHPGEGLEERVADYARQFSLIGETRWAEVERACAPEENELWVQAFELAQSHVEVREQTAADWRALRERGAGGKRSRPVLVFALEPREEAAAVRAVDAPLVGDAVAALEQALRDNLAVARSGGWATWIDWFTEALDRLRKPPAPVDPWFRVTSGCGVPSAVLSLARSAQKSHVFGGMGSWNDVPCDNTAERERLWKAMHDAWNAVFAALEAYGTATR